MQTTLDTATDGTTGEVGRRSSERAKAYQRSVFGKRYEGWDLSSNLWGEKEQVKIHTWLKKPRHFLVVIGPAGVGKTHFCASLIPWAIDVFKETFRYFTENSFLGHVRGSIEGAPGDYLLNLKYVLDDYLFIYDDFGSAGPTEWRKEVILKMVDDRYNMQWPTIITSNLGYKEIETSYGKRIASRIFSKENTIINLKDAPNLRDYDRDDAGNFIFMQ